MISIWDASGKMVALDVDRWVILVEEEISDRLESSHLTS
jgi:hypothetical protein